MVIRGGPHGDKGEGGSLVKSLARACSGSFRLNNIVRSWGLRVRMFYILHGYTM